MAQVSASEMISNKILPRHFCLSALSPVDCQVLTAGMGVSLLTTESSILVKRLLQRRLLIHIFAYSSMGEVGER